MVDYSEKGRLPGPGLRPAPAWASCPMSQQVSPGPQHLKRLSASSILPCHWQSLTRDGTGTGVRGLNGDQDGGL